LVAGPRWALTVDRNVTLTLRFEVGVDLAADSRPEFVWVSGLPLGPLTRFYVWVAFHYKNIYGAVLNSTNRKVAGSIPDEVNF
jgi:hypothetical protein